MATTPPALILDLPDEAATQRLAGDIAARLAPGDVIALSGGLGAGKTSFARALLRALAGIADLEVPSPTFTLTQTYAVGGLTVTHADLYRVTDPAELDELGLAEAAEEGAVLVEWPEHAGSRLPEARLTIALAIAGSGRVAEMTGAPAIVGRMARGLAARDVLDRAGFAGARRCRLAGDASARIYERVVSGEASAILMDWPPGAQLAVNDPRRKFRARDVTTFIAVDAALHAAGLSAPEILAADTERGFLVLEDFGDERVAVDGAPIDERYAVAIDALAALHAAPRPQVLPLAAGAAHRLSLLSGEVLLAELDLFADWYVPHVRGAPLAADARAELTLLWRSLDERLLRSEQSWVLFDVQSVNLLWLPARSGIARVGFIDFQDMFVGPSSYDVASLCFDARVDVPAPLAAGLLDRYIAARRAVDASFATDSFRDAFAIAAALRTMKNMGAFARLAETGKPQYLRHLERLSRYLSTALSRPVLSPLALWYERHLFS